MPSSLVISSIVPSALLLQLAMAYLGPLTPSFSAPEYCSTPLIYCSTLGYSFVDCTATYGLRCRADATPTRASECFPNGKAQTRTYESIYSYNPGESCPAGWSAMTTGTYTTTEYLSATAFAPRGTTYYRATSVMCCPSNYFFSGGAPCKSTYTPGPQVQYFCDLNSETITSTMTFPAATGTLYPTYIVVTDPSTTYRRTTYYNYAEANGIAYVSGSVGTGPWSTSTSSSRAFGDGYYGGGSSSGSGSSSSSGDTVEAARVRAKTMKIAVGIAVPVGLLVLGFVIMCCRKSSKKPKAATSSNVAASASHEQPQMVSTPPQIVQPGGAPPSNLQDPTPLKAFFAPAGNPPPQYIDERPPVNAVDRMSRLAQLEADRARIDNELARIRQAAPGEEQRRV